MKLVDIRPSMEGLEIPFLFSSLFSILVVSNAVDTITKTHSIAGSNTIVSSGGSFEMGFFSLGNSQNTYLGIWYKKISPKTVVWVANRDIPLIDSSGVLTVINPGIIALVNSTGSVIWSPNVTGSTQDPVAQLMESGNLVVKDANDTSEHFPWQSFDYPCNTLLPGMKLGKNFVMGLERHLSSWKSSDDPAPGEFTYWCDPQGYPQNILSRGSVDLFQTGPWNGIGFSGRPNRKPNTIYRYEVVYTKEEVYYHYELLSSVVSGFVLSHDGVVEHWTWIDRIQEWILYLTGPTDNCDKYKLCGPNGSCNVRNLPSCGCLSKFVPRNQTEWGNRDWSNGCVRRTTLDCKSGDGFLKYSQYKMPDTRSSWFDKNMTLKECEMICLENCSCMAYTNLDIRGGGSGCLLWFGELIDMREYSEDGPDIYIRMASSELGPTSRLEWKEKKDSSSDLGNFNCTSSARYVSNRVSPKKEKEEFTVEERRNLMHNSEQGHTDKSQTEDLELPLFDLAVIVNSTNNFSINNKLGEGGFGPVYKGILEGGQEIVVKRLSKNSSQGLDEFKNEVICIAKLQHRNLVKLLGCCIQGEETMLIYEYMPNKSLDYFIFGAWTKSEYAIDGLFSVKSDVFSFGVLVLEIVSGKKNRGFYHPGHNLNLLGHAWRLYEEGKSLELIDETLWDMRYQTEMLRSIHVGLLCVQESLEDRPSMSSIVLMLGNEATLPRAKQPGFITARNVLLPGSSSSKEATTSANEITITLLSAR
ncbi:unnamed protein product [Camellia sinensis]